MDRTHWQLGQTDLNLLCLGLVFQGVSIPLMSLSLQRPGNSHTRERKQVMRQVLAYLKGALFRLTLQPIRIMPSRSSDAIRISSNKGMTNRSDLDNIMIAYGHRWSIETAFGFLKSKGFHLQETRLTQPPRLHLLIALLTVGLLWCLLIGLQEHRRKPIVKKKHGRRAISLFRLGLDRLQQLITNPEHRSKESREAIQILLSCT